MADGRGQGLQIEIEGDRLVISIGIDALVKALRGADHWYPDELKVTDPDAFAHAIARELERDDDENGATAIQKAFDDAALRAIESASEGATLVRDEGE